jgi:hypothetical protein
MRIMEIHLSSPYFKKGDKLNQEVSPERPSWFLRLLGFYYIYYLKVLEEPENSQGYFSYKVKLMNNVLRWKPLDYLHR